MYLIIGLGNPENEYKNTRHNMGFDTINILAEKYNIQMNKNKFDAITGEGTIEGEKIILVKPQTYMNLSGKSAIQFVNFYKLDLNKVIVIYDDMDIDVGKIKLRKKGGAGSHNGMKSMVEELGSEEFPRVRVGIGKPKFANDSINYVIGAIPDEEKKILKESVRTAGEAICEVIKSGIDIAMNRFN